MQKKPHKIWTWCDKEYKAICVLQQEENMTKVGFFLATSPKVVPDSKSLETFMEKKKSSLVQ